MYFKEAGMDMQKRIPTLGDMDMVGQLYRMNPQDMEKEMEPKFKVGDKVVTKRGVFCEVISITEDWVQTRSYRTGLTFLWSRRHDKKLRHANIYDEAGERWRLACALNRLAGMTAAYTQEGYSNITHSAKLPASLDRAAHQQLKSDFYSYTERAAREAYKPRAPAQPIFRLKRNDGASGWEGWHFVLVAEDEREMLVRRVDINEAKVEDRVVTAQKDTWTREYSIGDEIINFLRARGGNFINKVVDNG